MIAKKSSAQKIWFPAKRYGLGWGVPVAWQGWVVIISYFILLLGGVIWLFFTQNTIYYMVYIFTITAILILICFIKGERLN
ncbi:MAG: hypothetical protein EOO69_08440 [Moraxellaceae bacterium]|nr:MAG: hypothetical protein EOO69_08440 [Moraxellaceae bacterium]